MLRVRRGLLALATAAATLAISGSAMANHMTAQGLAAGAFVPWGFNDDWFQCAGTTTCSEIAMAASAQPAGLSTARFKVQWNMVQGGGQHAPLNWGPSDDVHDEMLAGGMLPVMEISNAPSWANGNGPPETPPDLSSQNIRDAYRDFVRMTVERYAGPTPSDPGPRVAAIEIWNEPNYSYYWTSPNPGKYMELLELAREGVDDADIPEPKPPVLFGGLAIGAGGGGDISGDVFLAQAYDSSPDAAANFDGISIHPYPFPPAHSYETVRSPEEWSAAMWAGQIDPIKAVRDAKEPPGSETPCLWITEVGVPATWAGYFWPVNAPLSTPNEAEQGPRLAHLYASLYAHPCIKSFIIHSFNIWQGGDPRWDAMHLVKPPGYGGAPRPAFCHLAQKIGNPVC